VKLSKHGAVFGITVIPVLFATPPHGRSSYLDAAEAKPVRVVMNK
jgi:hypothetical protein